MYSGAIKGRPDRSYRRLLFDTLFQEGNGINSWAMRWLDRFWPIGAFVGKTWLQGS